MVEAVDKDSLHGCQQVCFDSDPLQLEVALACRARQSWQQLTRALLIVIKAVSEQSSTENEIGSGAFGSI